MTHDHDGDEMTHDHVMFCGCSIAIYTGVPCDRFQEVAINTLRKSPDESGMCDNCHRPIILGPVDTAIIAPIGGGILTAYSVRGVDASTGEPVGKRARRAVGADLFDDLRRIFKL